MAATQRREDTWGMRVVDRLKQDAAQKGNKFVQEADVEEDFADTASAVTRETSRKYADVSIFVTRDVLCYHDYYCFHDLVFVS
jgi:hypothetical protein